MCPKTLFILGGNRQITTKMFTEGRGVVFAAVFVRKTCTAPFCMNRFATITSKSHDQTAYTYIRTRTHGCRSNARVVSVRTKRFFCCHSLRLSLVRNVKHVAAYVDAKPDMPGLLQRFAAQAAPAPHVEDKARLPWLRTRVGVRVQMTE